MELMELQTQWLLVGGPAHGKTVWVKGGKSVMVAVDGGGYVEYKGTLFLFAGDYYCIGLLRPLDDDQWQYVTQTLLAAEFARRNFLSKRPGDPVDLAPVHLAHKNPAQGPNGPDWGAGIG